MPTGDHVEPQRFSADAVRVVTAWLVVSIAAVIVIGSGLATLVIVSVGAAVCVATSFLHGSPAERRSEPHRHIARCRRLEEPADVVVLLQPHGGVPHARHDWCDRVAAALRFTDTFEIHRGRGEVRAVLDGVSRSRASVERRILAAIGADPDDATPLAVGWARFPEDGFTFDALADRARDRARGAEPHTEPAESAAPGTLAAAMRMSVGIPERH